MTAGWAVPGGFVDAWIPEFVKSVVMFTGAAIAVERRDAAPDMPDDLLWHQQPFERHGDGLFWIGAPLQGAIRLLGEAAENETAGAALFRELLGQSLKATAEVLNTSTHQSLKCPDSSTTDAPPETAASTVLWIVGGSGDPVPVWLHCDQAFADLLEAADESVAKPSASGSFQGSSSPSPAPDSLHGIDLPVVVVLGRATLRIAEVLKLTVGSIVELDTRVGEPVDICIQGVVVARGEVVSVRGNYGVRIVEVIRRNRVHVQAAGARVQQPALAGAGAR